LTDECLLDGEVLDGQKPLSFNGLGVGTSKTLSVTN
jgi:hypothetical protein